MKKRESSLKIYYESKLAAARVVKYLTKNGYEYTVEYDARGMIITVYEY